MDEIWTGITARAETVFPSIAANLHRAGLDEAQIALVFVLLGGVVFQAVVTFLIHRMRWRNPLHHTAGLGRIGASCLILSVGTAVSSKADTAPVALAAPAICAPSAGPR
jgi:hypothetical protein